VSLDLTDHLERTLELSRAEAQAFLAFLQARELGKRQRWFHQGESTEAIALVERGCLRAYELDPEGRSHTIQLALEGDWTGDLGAFSGGSRSSYTLEALAPSRLLELARGRLEQAYREIPRLERGFRLLYERAYVAAQRRIVGAMALSAEARLEALLQERPALLERVPARHLASYLGITPEALSRIRARRR
jgi:CRP-like cAMP-binding protein